MGCDFDLRLEPSFGRSMTFMQALPEFLKPLEFLTSPFPREAVEETLGRREESTPYLLHAMDWANEHPDEANHADPPYMLHFFALFILAQWRETRACDPLLRLIRNPKVDDLLGDLVTERLPGILASVCGDDISGIQELITDTAGDEFVRTSALAALTGLVHAGKKTRPEISSFFDDLFHGGLEPEPCFVHTELVCACADLGLAEHLESIRSWYRDGIADPAIALLDDIEKEIALPEASPERRFDPRYSLINDIVAEMQKWSCFEPHCECDHCSAPQTSALFEKGSAYDAINDLHEDLKIGRNDPCPCGSGRKYKKCCAALA